jgi:PadR family transcriptional regulator
VLSEKRFRLFCDAYAVPIREFLEERTGRSVARGALYTTLQRMEAKGYLSSRMGEPTPERGGRAKRFWTVTPTGIAALQASRDALVSLWGSVVLGPPRSP